MKHLYYDIFRMYLQKLMQLRGFKGELIFDSEDSTLDLKVIPRDKDQVTVASGTNSLSGGERSYVTVSLLISLWKCVDHPFYFLDEYDVFTVNRRASVAIDTFHWLNIVFICFHLGSRQPEVPHRHIVG